MQKAKDIQLAIEIILIDFAQSFKKNLLIIYKCLTLPDSQG
jgi:hypothetical protein